MNNKLLSALEEIFPYLDHFDCDIYKGGHVCTCGFYGRQSKFRDIVTELRTNESVMVSKKMYDSLVEDVRFLRCLEQAGVDNWEGFSHAHEILAEWKTADKK